MGMQKQITAKRGQIDALQSKVQFLEEAVTSANKVSLCPERPAWSPLTRSLTHPTAGVVPTHSVTKSLTHPMADVVPHSLGH